MPTTAMEVEVLSRAMATMEVEVLSPPRVEPTARRLLPPSPSFSSAVSSEPESNFGAPKATSSANVKRSAKPSPTYSSMERQAFAEMCVQEMIAANEAILRGWERAREEMAAIMDHVRAGIATLGEDAENTSRALKQAVKAEKALLRGNEVATMRITKGGEWCDSHVL